MLVTRRHSSRPLNFAGDSEQQKILLGAPPTSQIEEGVSVQNGGSWSPWEGTVADFKQDSGMPRGAAMSPWPARAGHGDMAVYPAQPALADKVVDKRIGPVPRPGEPAPQLGLRR